MSRLLWIPAPLVLAAALTLAAPWDQPGAPERSARPEAPPPERSAAVEAAPAPRTSGPGFDPHEAGFAVRVGDAVIPYTVFGLFVMPGEALTLEPTLAAPGSRFDVTAESGRLEPDGDERWRWKPPGAPGLYRMTVTNTADDERIRLHVFVLTPFDHQSTSLGDFRIGQYQARPRRGNPAYERPEGFVRLTPAVRDVQVAPHFTLGQFVCKQDGGYPKYLLVEERLLLKLEMILRRVNERGTEASTLHVMSGFRTPWYNRSIGNRTTYSRHLYGGAADVFVDTDGDEVMDDLDGDGQVSRADAEVMAAMVDGMTEEPWYAPLVGGLGIYGPASHRGPFIHVDVRGETARW